MQGGVAVMNVQLPHELSIQGSCTHTWAPDFFHFKQVCSLKMPAAVIYNYIYNYDILDFLYSAFSILPPLLYY
jgi:hypothetical protein